MYIGVKRAVCVAAGEDYTLVLTSATIPTLPYEHLLYPPLNNIKHEKSPSIVVVMGKVGVKGSGSKVDDIKYDSNLNSPNNSDSDSEDSDENEESVIPCESSNFDEISETFDNYSQVLTLKELCEIRIAKSVDTRNVVALLANAEALDAKGLAAFCNQYIRSNFDAILVQSKLADLDILIDDSGSLDATLSSNIDDDTTPLPTFNTPTKQINSSGKLSY
jgi:hypothetical protein